MKIIHLKWDANHPILKGLDINLMKVDGTPYNNIIIAGDNGCGKTTLLRSISDLMSGKACNFESFQYQHEQDSFDARQKADDTFQLSRNGGDYTDVELSNYHKHMGDLFAVTVGELDDYAPQKHLSRYSMATTAFEAVNENDNTVRELLITLEHQDNEDYRIQNMVAEQAGNMMYTPSEFKIHLSRVERFRKAFNLMFDSIEFIGIQTTKDAVKVLFSKNNQLAYDIQYLSTGEKQVVYRGTELLTGANGVSVALIDEPELSMHPFWQSKIFSYYRSLFTDAKTQQQTAQIFIATHSDRIIASAINDPDTLIIRLKDNNGTLVANPTGDTVLDTPSASEINYLAFGICSYEYHILLFSQLHNTIATNRNLTDISIKDTDLSIKQQAEYDSNIHDKLYAYTNRNGNTSTYDTLPAYIRNCIDHPGANNPITQQINEFNDAELETSTELLRTLIISQKNNTYQY